MKEVYELEAALEAARTKLAERYGVKLLDANPSRIYITTDIAHCSCWSYDQDPNITMLCSTPAEPTIEAMQKTVAEFEADKKKMLKIVEEWKNDLQRNW